MRSPDRPIDVVSERARFLRRCFRVTARIKQHYRALLDDALWPKDRALRILQLGSGPLTLSLLTLQRHRDIVLAVIEPNRRRFDSAEELLAEHGNVTLADTDRIGGLGKFDLIVAVESLHQLSPGIGLVGVRQLLAPRGILLALSRRLLCFLDLMMGLAPGGATAARTTSIRRTQTACEWSPALKQAGFVNTHAELVDCGHGRGVPNCG